MTRQPFNAALSDPGFPAAVAKWRSEFAEMRRIARQAALSGQPLPASFLRCDPASHSGQTRRQPLLQRLSGAVKHLLDHLFRCTDHTSLKASGGIKLNPVVFIGTTLETPVDSGSLSVLFEQLRPVYKWQTRWPLASTHPVSSQEASASSAPFDQSERSSHLSPPDDFRKSTEASKSALSDTHCANRPGHSYPFSPPNSAHSTPEAS